MKKILIVSMLCIAGAASAQVNVTREELGSGTPGQLGNEVMLQVDKNVYFAPQYMPYFPTAATIYPRVMAVPCAKTATGMTCKGYNWLPEMGRGEYLMLTPAVVLEPTKVVEKVTVVTPGPTVFVEVPVKKKKE
jgi:hypothetical protein